MRSRAGKTLKGDGQVEQATKMVKQVTSYESYDLNTALPANLRNYMILKETTHQNFLLKLAALNAFVNGRGKIVQRDVELAFIDLFEFVVLELDYINNHILGVLDYGVGWRGARKEDQESLKWLYDQGAISFEESNVMIRTFIEAIAEIHRLSKEGAKKKYQRYKKNRWVDGKQVGKDDSRVWLMFAPEEVMGGKEGKGGKGSIEKYTEKIKEFFSEEGYHPYPPDDNVTADGGEA